jgi:hypothetical protein
MEEYFLELEQVKLLCVRCRWTPPELKKKILEAFQYCLSHSLDTPNDIRDELWRVTCKQCIVIKNCESWSDTPSIFKHHTTWLYKNSLWDVLIC